MLNWNSRFDRHDPENMTADLSCQLCRDQLFLTFGLICAISLRSL
jgi:hypothetical protein